MYHLKFLLPKRIRRFLRDLDQPYQDRLLEIENLHQDHQQYQLEIEKLHQDHQQYQLEIENLHQDHQQYQLEIEKLHQDHQQYQLEIEKLHQDHQQYQLEIEKLHQDKISINRSYSTLDLAYKLLQEVADVAKNSNLAYIETSYQNIQVLTHKPVAYDSPDHIQPWGTKQDNSINLKFNLKLARWILPSNLSVLDIGCSGGGFVRSMLEMGFFAVGIEGSDYSKKIGRAEWSTIPNFLFTADATEPFQILVNRSMEPFKFTVITAWEFIEHIHREHLQHVFSNIDTHLAENGVAIISVSPNEEIINGIVLHQTVENKDWWLQECERNGFIHHENLLTYFDNDYIRFEDNAPNSFHLILTRQYEQCLFPVLQ